MKQETMNMRQMTSGRRPNVRLRVSCFLFLVSCAVFFLPVPAVALPVLPPGIDAQLGAAAAGAGAGQQPEVQEVVARVIRSVLGILGILLVALLIYGGFLWMTAGGNEQQVDKAKKTIRNAVIGLIIVMLSYGIARFVVAALQRASASGR